MTPCTHPCVARGLRKRYDARPALDGVGLAVAAGTVHGLLGPNGAGKTTVVRKALATLIRFDGAGPASPGSTCAASTGSAPRSGWSGRTRRSTRSSAAGRTW